MEKMLNSRKLYATRETRAIGLSQTLKGVEQTMKIPTVAQLMHPTLELIAKGVDDSKAMREELARQFQISGLALKQHLESGTALFVNNHAWALVRLQAEGKIKKVREHCYALTATGKRGMHSDVTEDHPVVPPQQGSMPSWATRLISTANQRNRRWGRPDLRVGAKDIVYLWNRQGGRCAVTQLPFSIESVGKGQAKHPFAPSLDRIDPERFYQLNNLRLVMAGVNFGINSFGLGTYLRLAKAAVNVMRKAI
jgi:hypothetical protein